MYFQSSYQSPLGKMTLVTSERGLHGLWFANQTHFGKGFDLLEIPQVETPIHVKVCQWLTTYFKGEMPELEPAIFLPIGTPYRQRVWRQLSQIPYGETVSYQWIAEQLNKEPLAKKTAARAVGGAVGHNPISLFIPCHRVVGSNGAITGYAGGIERKQALLDLETRQ